MKTTIRQAENDNLEVCDRVLQTTQILGRSGANNEFHSKSWKWWFTGVLQYF